MSVERTSRTISVACIASAAVHALLYIALSTYGQRPIEPSTASAEVQLVLAPSPADQPPKIDPKPAPEPPKPDQPKPEIKPPEPPPPKPTPQEPERVRLGNQNSPETDTKTWLGDDKPGVNQARKSSVEQGAFTQSPGLPGQPSDTMGPESEASASPPAPSTSQPDAPTPATESPDLPPPQPSPESPTPVNPPPTTTPPTDAASTQVDSSDASPAPSSPPSARSTPSAPSPSTPPPPDPDGLQPTAPLIPPAPPAPVDQDLAKLLTPKDTSNTSDIDLEDLFPPVTLTPSSEKPVKPPMTRERAIALLREALAFPLVPRSSTAATQPTPPSPSNPQPQGGGSTGDRPFEKSDRDVDPSSLEDPIEVRPGRPLAAKGLEIKTVPLDLTTLSRRFSYTTNPVVLVKFGRRGTVLHADFVYGQTAGSPEWNNALLSAMYRWTAAGEELKKLPMNNPEAGVEVQFRILLRD